VYTLPYFLFTFLNLGVAGFASTDSWGDGRERLPFPGICQTAGCHMSCYTSSYGRETSLTSSRPGRRRRGGHNELSSVSPDIFPFSQRLTEDPTRTPIELVKCKMQVQMLMATPRGSTKLPGPIAVLTSVIRKQGIMGLWLGHTGTLIRETGGTASWFCTKEFVASLLLARRLGNEASSSTSKAIHELRPWESALSGAMAGVAFNLSLFPADTVKSAMQTEDELRPRNPHSSATSVKPSFLKTFAAMYRAKGIRGLYAGCGITIARSIPSSAIIFLIYDELKKYFS